MGFISRGFRGRQQADAPAGRIPPGQYVTPGFPVLSAGPTPQVKLDAWRFEITGQVDTPRTWTWQELQALPAEDVTVDIHCVTKWSKLDTAWKGVSVDTLLKDIPSAAGFVMAHSYGGYTTNLPLADVTGGKAWVAYAFDGKPLQNLYDFTYALRGKKPGDEVKVKVMRDGKPLEVTCVLARRE